jgi:hypothetical protein
VIAAGADIVPMLHNDRVVVGNGNELLVAFEKASDAAFVYASQPGIRCENRGYRVGPMRLDPISWPTEKPLTFLVLHVLYLTDGSKDLELFEHLADFGQITHFGWSLAPIDLRSQEEKERQEDELLDTGNRSLFVYHVWYANTAITKRLCAVHDGRPLLTNEAFALKPSFSYTSSDRSACKAHHDLGLDGQNREQS